MADSKRRNFTEREKSLLLNIVDKYKDIIENKCTNAVTTHLKFKTWDRVKSEFNSNAESPRTAKQLNTLYLNLKRVTRHNIANINKAIKETGGSSYKPQLSDVGAKMLAIMGTEVKSSPITCDSGSEYCIDEVNNVEINMEEDSSENDDKSQIEILPDETISSDYKMSTSLSVKPLSQLKRPQNRILPPKKKENINILKRKYYRNKFESALIEKKNKLLEYKLNLKKQSLLDYELKIKRLEYEKLLKTNDT